MKEDTDPETIFNIAMGAVGGKQITQQHRICMDDIVLEKIEAPEIKPEEIGENLLTNGDFSDGTNGWDINTNADQMATTVVTDGGIVFQVKNPGENDWDVQLNQNGFTLEKGCKYRVKFKVTSTKARTIKLGLMDNNCQKWYGGADQKRHHDRIHFYDRGRVMAFFCILGEEKGGRRGVIKGGI